jgi:hypothetical protein
MDMNNARAKVGFKGFQGRVFDSVLLSTPEMEIVVASHSKDRPRDPHPHVSVNVATGSPGGLGATFELPTSEARRLAALLGAAADVADGLTKGPE